MLVPDFSACITMGSLSPSGGEISPVPQFPCPSGWLELPAAPHLTQPFGDEPSQHWSGSTPWEGCVQVPWVGRVLSQVTFHPLLCDLTMSGRVLCHPNTNSPGYESSARSGLITSRPIYAGYEYGLGKSEYTPGWGIVKVIETWK